MLLGAHCGISRAEGSKEDGIWNSLLHFEAIGGEVMQIFSRNQMQWQAKPLEEEAVKRFKTMGMERGLREAVVHCNYLINLASPEKAMRAKAVDAFVMELERAETLGCTCLIFHPGSHKGEGVEKGVRNIAESLNEAHARTKGVKVLTLLENAAGQGDTMGRNFDELAAIIDGVAAKERMRVCFDTCHAFASGLDFRDEEGYNEVFDKFGSTVGIDRLRCFHLNDSKAGLGERLDRHEEIGKGKLGKEPFRLLVNDRRFPDIPGIIETPHEDDAGFAKDLKILRGLVGKEGKKRIVRF
ncbi:MAG TPA: deoxyribonuclease IV [Thermoplasmata archaeon]|nr:deoxyribonuclease IV [Thermoplasmata archaeon]